MPKYLNSIPDKELKDWVGKPFDRIDQTAVSPTSVRVNVWTKTEQKDCIVPKWSIDRSYVLCYNGNKITDLTIKRKYDE